MLWRSLNFTSCLTENSPRDMSLRKERLKHTRQHLIECTCKQWLLSEGSRNTRYFLFIFKKNNNKKQDEVFSDCTLYTKFTCMSMLGPDACLSFLPLPDFSVSDPDENSSWPSSSFKTFRLVVSCCSWSLFNWWSFFLSVSLSLRCPRSPSLEVLKSDSSRPWLLSKSC